MIIDVEIRCLRLIWFDGEDIKNTLHHVPEKEIMLRLCGMFNEKASCCHASFERELMRFFHFWRQIFYSKSQNLRTLHVEKNVWIFSGIKRRINL